MDMFQLRPDPAMTEDVPTRNGISAQMLPPGDTNCIGRCGVFPEGADQGLALKKPVVIHFIAILSQPSVNVVVRAWLELEEQQSGSL
jgi:hypothetical protein